MPFVRGRDPESVDSSQRRPGNCRPTSRLPDVKPHGTVIAGNPASGAPTVKMSLKYI
jgi:hypothetical protein